MSYEDLTAEILEDPTFMITGSDIETIIDDAIMMDHEDYISWDIGEGQIVAYPNPVRGEKELHDYEVERLVQDHVKKARQLDSIELLTSMCTEVYIIKDDIKKLAFLSYSTEGFKERGIYTLKNPSSIYPQTWKGGLFTGNVNPNNPGVWHKILKPLFRDFTILKEAVIGKYPSLNYAVVPSKSINTTSKYEVRYFGLRLSKPNESYTVDKSYYFHKYSKAEGVVGRVGLAIKLLMEFEPEMKLNVGPLDLAKAIYNDYLSPHPYVPSTLESLSSEEIQNFSDSATIPEYAPKDLDSVKIAYFVDQVSLIERLLGPISMSIYQLNDRLIYIFGDMHVPTGALEAGAYVTLETFFEYFFSNSPIPCDLFLESYAFLNVPYNSSFNKYEDKFFTDVKEDNVNELGKIKESVRF